MISVFKKYAISGLLFGFFCSMGAATNDSKASQRIKKLMLPELMLVRGLAIELKDARTSQQALAVQAKIEEQLNPLTIKVALRAREEETPEAGAAAELIVGLVLRVKAHAVEKIEKLRGEEVAREVQARRAAQVAAVDPINKELRDMQEGARVFGLQLSGMLTTAFEKRLNVLART